MPSVLSLLLPVTLSASHTAILLHLLPCPCPQFLEPELCRVEDGGGSSPAGSPHFAATTPETRPHHTSSCLPVASGLTSGGALPFHCPHSTCCRRSCERRKRRQEVGRGRTQALLGVAKCWTWSRPLPTDQDHVWGSFFLERVGC